MMQYHLQRWYSRFARDSWEGCLRFGLIANANTEVKLNKTKVATKATVKNCKIYFYHNLPGLDEPVAVASVVAKQFDGS